MIIIFVIAVFLLNKKLRQTFKDNLMSQLFILIAFVCFYIELKYLNRATYYSDAETYWNLFLNRDFSSYTRIYVFYVWICNFFGATEYPWLVSLSNYALYLISVQLVNDCCMEQYKLDISELKIMNFFLLTNGIIIFMYLRTLKDILFLFFVVLLVYLYFKSFLSKWYLISYALYSACVFLIFIELRPWAYILALALAVIRGSFLFRKNHQKILYLIVAAILFIVYNLTIDNTAQSMASYNENFIETVYLKSNNPLLLFIKYFIFLMGPGIGRVINYKESFQFYMQTGNVLILLGNVSFYYILSLYVIKFFSNIKENFVDLLKQWANPFIVISFIFITVYVFAYNGSAETRLRAFAYFMLIPFIFSQIHSMKKFQRQNIYTGIMFTLTCVVMVIAK